jgi:hypothetical protein
VSGWSRCRTNYAEGGSPQSPEEFADVGDQAGWFLQRGEMSAAVHVDPAGDGVIGLANCRIPTSWAYTIAAVGTPLLILGAPQAALCT